MAKVEYTTPLKGGSWSVGVHEHGAGSFNYDPVHVATYEAGQGQLGEIGRSAMSGYDTKGGARDPRWTRDGASPASVPADDAGPHNRYNRRATVRMWTPEGHELSTEHVQGLMSDTHDPQALREHYADQHEIGQQHDYEARIRAHIARHGELPHSGVDALMAGVPAATSAEGVQISSLMRHDGSNGGTWLPSSHEMPHYSLGAGHENPSAGSIRKALASPPDRGSQPGRIVDHRV